MLQIDLAQLNTWFGAAMPAIVALIAGLIRQDGWKPATNELISTVVILALAITQTLLGGAWGGSGLANFAIITALAFIGLDNKYGQMLQLKIQTTTSVVKAAAPSIPFPTPAPIVIPPINTQALAEEVMKRVNLPYLASLLKDELVALGTAAPPIDQQPTTSIQAVRTSTPPPMGG